MLATYSQKQKDLIDLPCSHSRKEGGSTVPIAAKKLARVRASNWTFDILYAVKDAWGSLAKAGSSDRILLWTVSIISASGKWQHCAGFAKWFVSVSVTARSQWSCWQRLQKNLSNQNLDLPRFILRSVGIAFTTWRGEGHQEYSNCESAESILVFLPIPLVRWTP